MDEVKGLQRVTEYKKRMLYTTESTVLKGPHAKHDIEEEAGFYSLIFSYFKQGVLGAPIALVYVENSGKLYYVEERLDYSFLAKLEEYIKKESFNDALELVKNLGRFLGKLTQKSLFVHEADADPEHFRLREDYVVLVDVQDFQSSGTSLLDIGR